MKYDETRSLNDLVAKMQIQQNSQPMMAFYRKPIPFHSDFGLLNLKFSTEILSWLASGVLYHKMCLLYVNEELQAGKNEIIRRDFIFPIFYRNLI